MKALLKADLSKDLFIKPYDFVGEDKKRAMGISFRQDGTKLVLKIDNAPTKEKDWFKTAAKKDIRRFFEDLTEWYQAEIEEKIIPLMDSKLPEVKEVKKGLGAASSEAPAKPADEIKDETPEPVKETKPKVTNLKMKRALKEYLSANYEGKELPQLSQEDLVLWYELSLKEEELPFESATDASVEDGDLDEQLNALLPSA